MIFRGLVLKSRALLFGILLLMLLVPAVASAAQERLIVGFKVKQSSRVQAKVLREAGIEGASHKNVQKHSITKLRAVVIPVEKSQIQAVRKKLLKRSDVAYVEIDHIAKAYDQSVDFSWPPNDPSLIEQWGLNSINVPKAWEFARGEGTTVAVLDTGVDYAHPDLKGQVILGHDYVDNDDNPMDAQGHGTHVSGVIAAATNNNVGVAGIAPSSKILAIRVLDSKGEGNYSWIAEAIVAAVGSGAKVINLSLGGTESSPLLENAINYAAARGVIIACASGNEGAKELSYPARYESCTSVGAVGAYDEHPDFSNTGKGLDFTAPGISIYSTLPNGNYEAWDGTSMAAPYVSATAALLYSQGLRRRQVIDAMSTTAKDLGAQGTDPVFGAGKIDAGAALEAGSRMPRAVADTQPPIISDVQILKGNKVVRSTAKKVWVVTAKSKWKRVGTTLEAGNYQWTDTITKKGVKVVNYYKAARGIVYLRTVKLKTTIKIKKSYSAYVRVKVEASDDQGLDRMALEVDGKTRVVDWTGDDGWVLETSCQSGVHTFLVRVWDIADQSSSRSIKTRLSC